jgi:hypothetical protein
MTTTEKRTAGAKRTPLTSYEKGQRAGKWTLTKVFENGFVNVHACLKKQEQEYGKLLADLEKKAAEKPDEGVARQIEYLKGYLEATRQSLNALIKQGHH